jgi:fido (protein-threonine AMPylation protein)
MSLFFKTRTGQTPIDESILKDLKLTHVQDMTELYEHEEINIAHGINWVRSTKKSHTDYMVWFEIHKHMLAEIWKFAGKPRSIELANQDFLKPYEVRPALHQLEKDLIYWIENKTYQPKEMLAVFHERLLTIHPFRDGNGRWSRVVTEFVASRLENPIPHWGAHIKDDEERRNRYIDAVKKARHHHAFQDLIHIMFHSD